MTVAPKFAVGDLVRHRASGERGVVVGLPRQCTNPDQAYTIFGSPHSDCRTEWTGCYELSMGVGQSATVPEVELEAAEHDERPRTRVEGAGIAVLDLDDFESLVDLVRDLARVEEMLAKEKEGQP